MNEKIKVLIIKPKCEPKVTEIENKFEVLQELVDGIIDIVSTDDGQCDIVINDEGKLMGLPLNRFRKFDGKIYDCFVGTMIIMAHDRAGNSISLTDEEIERYKEYYSLNHFYDDFFEVFLPHQGGATVEWEVKE